MEHGSLGIAAAAAIVLVLLLGPAFPTTGASSGHENPPPSAPRQPPVSLASAPALLPPGGDFPTYLGNIQRDGTPQHEQLITAATAATLHPLWNFTASGAFDAQAIVVGGVVYLGNLDGDEYALNSLTGAQLWSTYLGQDTQDPGCGTSALGIVSSPTVSGNNLYLYGGDANFYAVNIHTGKVAWSAQVGNLSQGYFGWGSPLVRGNYAYVGIASRCDKPLVPGGLVQISLASHKVVALFNTTSPGLVGSSIWSTPSFNSSSNTLFATTGNQNGTTPRGLGESILALNATTLQLEHYWQVPVNQTVTDSDFGSTPTLFTPKGGPAMVAAVNKNGIAYAWYQSNLTLAWELNLSSTTTISTMAWSGLHLYVMGPTTVIRSHTYPSSVRELNPKTGQVIWQDGLSIPHTGYASPFWVNSALIVAENQSVEVLNAMNGKLLASWLVNGSIESPPTVSRGEVYVSTGHGHLYAFDLNLTLLPAESPIVGGPAPLTENFTLTVQGGLPQYTYNWSFGDGNYSSAADPIHTYAAAGSYSVLVTVTDLAGSTVSARMTVDAT
jgi:outer membrane protein assembly factor BamB